MKRSRSIRICGQGGYRYRETPAIIHNDTLAYGQGGEIGDYVMVSCKNGRLIPEFIGMLDDERLTIIAGVELFCLSEAEQRLVERILERNCKYIVKDARRLRETGGVTEGPVEAVLVVDRVAEISNSPGGHLAPGEDVQQVYGRLKSGVEWVELKAGIKDEVAGVIERALTMEIYAKVRAFFLCGKEKMTDSS